VLRKAAMHNSRLIKWKAEYSVGNDLLDRQHHKIIDLLNYLHSAIRQKESISASSILLELIHYTRTHFADEESLMEKNSFPDCHSHKIAHERLIQKTRKINELKNSVSGDISLDLFQFLKQWWLSHILEVDMKYKGYL
jgi:hemerythrin